MLLLAPESGDCTEAEGGVADDGGELKEDTGGGCCCCFIRYSEPGNSKSLVDARVQPQKTFLKEIIFLHLYHNSKVVIMQMLL